MDRLLVVGRSPDGHFGLAFSGGLNPERGV